MKEIDLFFAVERQRQMSRYIFMAKWQGKNIKYKRTL